MIKAVLTIDDIASDNTPALVDYLVERGGDHYGKRKRK